MSQPSNIGHIVDRQVSLWGSKQGVQVERRPSVRDALKKPTEGPWITISTQLGAGGPELAARLSERLGWRVIDKEILQEIAKTTHTPEQILSHFDEHAVGAFEDYVAHLFAPGQRHGCRVQIDIDIVRLSVLRRCFGVGHLIE